VPTDVVSVENSEPRVLIEPACFGTPVRLRAAEPPLPVRLGARHSEALSELVPLLLCGEESAVLSFARYGSSALLGASGRRDFQLLQADEASHARYLQSLRGSLPVPRSDAHQRARLRRFYARLSDLNFGDHLARIAALDSAVCFILGALRQRRGPIAKDAAVGRMFERIHQDEARHVTIACRYAVIFGKPQDLYSVAADTRDQLAAMLSERADAFESLGVCADRLLHRVRTIPRNLFA
jgi:hypothetical protein